MSFQAKSETKEGRRMVNVKNKNRNHERSERLLGHPYVGRLSSQEKVMLGQMVDNKVKPGNMLLALNNVNPNNLTTIRQVYNEYMPYIKLKRGL